MLPTPDFSAQPTLLPPYLPLPLSLPPVDSLARTDPREPGHESTSCPQPRSTDGKQCYACGGVGHVKTDCPSVRGPFGFGGAAGPKCYQCGRPGHIARQCGAGGAPGGGFRGGFPRAPFAPRPRAPVTPDGTPVKC